MSAPFVVVGGGITGLAAAWELTTAGHRVLLVEGSDRFGGKVYSEMVDGFLLEHGPDSFVNYRPGAVRMATDLGLADEIVPAVPPRLVHLRVGGRMEPIPAGMGMVLPTRLGPFVRTRILTWPQKLRAAVDLVLPRVLGPQDMSIGALLRHIPHRSWVQGNGGNWNLLNAGWYSGRIERTWQEGGKGPRYFDLASSKVIMV